MFFGFLVIFCRQIGLLKNIALNDFQFVWELSYDQYYFLF